jgi:uncharacterized protein
MDRPAILPLFPLPNVVLFPKVLLPLHIFEPRYREMVRDAAAGEELIGMILLRGPERGGDDLYSVGCAGRMIRKVDLPDGRSNILLQGVREFVPLAESPGRSYRRAEVEWGPPPQGDFRLDREIRDHLVRRVHEFVGDASAPGLRILFDPTLNDETLINLFSFALDVPVAEKQSLLEIRDLGGRARQLIDILEFHALERAGSPGIEHSKQRAQ